MPTLVWHIVALPLKLNDPVEGVGLLDYTPDQGPIQMDNQLEQSNPRLPFLRRRSLRRAVDC